MLTTILSTVSAALLSLSSTPQAQTIPKIPILVVSGANNHDWRWTTPSLVKILEDSGQFDVTVTYEPEKDLADREGLDQYRAVVLDYNGKRWGTGAESSFLDAVTQGLGVVVVHAADNHGKDWVEYEKLVGDLWREGTGHGRFHPFNIEMTARDHPITHSLPDFVLHPDELYHRLVNVHGVERRVLATAMSDPATGGTGNTEPMILVKNYGKGRVFHTPLGHAWINAPLQQASHRDPQFQGLIARGTEWAATGTVRDVLTAPEPLTDEQKAAGWISLMERSQWRSFSGSAVPPGWEFNGETIVLAASAGDIVTDRLWDDFELTFDWKTTIAGNSGLKYRIPQGAEKPIGIEFQLLDAAASDTGADHRMGAIYDVLPAADAPFTPWGEYRSARIVVRGDKVEHYLDGQLIAAADVSSDEWQAAVAASKFAKVEGFGQPAPGRILLQDHSDEVWIRGMRIRPLKDGADDSDGPDLGLEKDQRSLLPTGGDLGGWNEYGDALYRVEGDTLIGSAGPDRKQSFLISQEIFSDFELEVDLQVEVEGNSGVQFRSHLNESGRFYGYQAEIDPSKRGWSAGIFDESRRGWINDLSANEPARKAFKKEGWNHFRIVTEGPHIRTWVNGVAAADLLDGADLSGHFGWQVHGGDDDIQMRWRNPRIKTTGAHAWTGAAPSARFSHGAEFEAAPALRVRVAGDESSAVLHYADGTQSAAIPFKASKYWHDQGTNTVTAIRSGARTVIQLNDRTVYDQTTTQALAIEFRDATTERWERCTRV